MPQKKFKYYILSGTGYATVTELEADPIGWDNHDIALSRSDDFGLNVQNIVPLSFTKNGKELLKAIYSSTGAYSKAKIRIDKRNDDWTYSEFYTYKVDFKTYVETKSSIEVQGIEDGLLSKIQKFKDTEYEIDLPEIKNYINYEGLTIEKKNIIQCSYSSCIENSNNDWYLRGTRSVRSYSADVVYTDSNGLPYETATLRAVNNCTIDLRLFIDLYVASANINPLSPPYQGTLMLVKHNASFTILGASLWQSAPTKEVLYFNQRYDYFQISNAISLSSISLNAGELISLIYANTSLFLTTPTVKDAEKSYIEIYKDELSPYTDRKIEFFTYEWLVQQLVQKIYPNAIVGSDITYGTHYKPVLSATPCLNGGTKLKAKLSDVLKSFDNKCFIGIDIQEDYFTIKNRADLYSGAKKLTVYGTNITVEHNDKHQFKTFSVGSNVDERGENDDLVYPFIVKKEFETSDCEFDSTKDLIDPFMCDPYDIERYMQKINEDEQTQDECKFMVFCIEPFVPSEGDFTLSRTTGWYDDDEAPNDVDDANAIAESQEFTLDASGSISFKSHVYSNYWGAPDSWGANVQIINTSTSEIVFFDTFSHPITGGNFPEKVSNVNLDAGSYKIQVICHTYAIDHIDYPDEDYSASAFAYLFGLEDDDIINITYGSAYATLFKDHSISNFTGNSASMFNVPITPKRILAKHDSYISISNYGNSAGQLNFLSSSFKNTNISSKLGYESSFIDEDIRYQQSNNVLFLPCIIKFDTVGQVIDISDIIGNNDNKYDYIEVIDKKSGKVVTGWLNSYTFAVAKSKKKSVELQARTL